MPCTQLLGPYALDLIIVLCSKSSRGDVFDSQRAANRRGFFNNGTGSRHPHHQDLSSEIVHGAPSGHNVSLHTPNMLAVTRSISHTVPYLAAIAYGNVDASLPPAVELLVASQLHAAMLQAESLRGWWLHLATT